MELWLDEELELNQGRALKVRVTKVLESLRTKYQRLDIVETQSYGRMLLLDGVIMFTMRDEFCYHEMISHVPLMSHPNPEKILIIGGGDGGAVREILKHKSVKEITLCDIDEMVPEMSRKYFPEISCGLSDSRVKLVCEDGSKYIKDFPNYFDIIIIDSTDPIGPGATLFERPFYFNMKEALSEGGIITTQAESFQYHKEIIEKLFAFIPQIAKEYGYYWTSIPTYPSGVIGFAFLSDKINPYTVELNPQRVPKDLKYYSINMHRASFVLPPFAEDFVQTTKPGT